MDTTILLAQRPHDANDAWLPRSLVALARRFEKARVRLLVPDVDREALAGGVRSAPPAADFDVVVLIERPKAVWSPPRQPESAGPPDDSLAWLSGARGYRAHSRTLRARDATPRAAERSPGLVFAATAVRSPALDPEAFDAHWHERHAPLALRHHAGLCAYEQHTIVRPLTATATTLDGLALLHFASPADYRDRFYDDTDGEAAILEDARRFLDLPQCTATLLGEHWARP